MAVDYYWKRNDVGPGVKIQAVLSDEDGVLADLTGATVKCVIAVGTAGDTKVNAAATVDSIPLGMVGYIPVAGDTNTAGTYNVEWVVTWAGDGTVQTFPDPGYQTLEISADLDNA